MAKPTWYPNNDADVIGKCNRENNVTPEMEEDISNLTNTPLVQAIVLCRVKGINIYNDETGWNIERMNEMFLPNNPECRKVLVQECVDKFKNLDSKGEMAFKTIDCIAEKEVDKKTTC